MAKDSGKNKIMDETFGTINSALAILEKIPEVDDNNISLSVSNVSPVSFILRLLYQTVGYDKVMEFVANKVLVVALDSIELAVKTHLLTQLKYIFDCTLNPFITYDVLKNGIVFDLKTVDIMNILQYSPLDKTVNNKQNNGKWYYFGCENFNYPDQLEQAEDFNALLWYMKNRAVGARSVWYGHKNQGRSNQFKSLNQKQTKSDGIITLEYSARPNGLKDSEGNGMTIQTPFNNCLHVFIGNTKAIDSGQTNNDEIIEVNEKISKFNKLKEICADEKKKLNETLLSLKTDGLSKVESDSEKSKIETYIKYMDTIIMSINNGVKLSDALSDIYKQGDITRNKENGTYTLIVEPTGDTIVMDNETYNGVLTSLVAQKKGFYDDAMSQHSRDTYRPVEYNYYYHKTLLKFNTDYIFSLKLFDGKAMAARLLDALSGCLTVGVDLSLQERIVQNEVRKMVHDMIENDETVVSDCFFTFDNDTYNDMVERSEYQRLGLYVSPNGLVGGTMDVDAIMASLNELSPDATQEQIQSAIKSSLFELNRQILPEYAAEIDVDFDYNFRSNLIDNLLQTLAYVIVLTVLSPKLYLLIAVNLKIMGRESTFDLVAFIDNFKQLISGTVQTIRDELMRLFKEWLMEIVGNLAKEVGAKLALEQMMYYQQLLRRCIDCFNRQNTIGWNQQDVEYADIYSTGENQPTNSEC